MRSEFHRLSPVLLAVAAVIAACWGCRPGGSSPKASGPAPDIPYGEVREGDLVFRRGTGVYSTLLGLGETADAPVVYSHVGVVLKAEDGQGWRVVHAVPKEDEQQEDGGMVVCDSLERFFCPELAIHGTMVHTGVQVTDRMRARAFRWVGERRPFDWKFDIADTTSLYCTEMVQLLFLMGGTDLSEGRCSYPAVPFLGSEPVLAPSDLLEYSGAQSYFTF